MRWLSREAGEAWAALVVALFGAGIVAAVPGQAGSSESIGLGPRPMPYALGGGLLALGLSLVWNGMRRARSPAVAGARAPRSGVAPRLWAPWVAVAAIVVHVALFDLVGYRLATAALLLGLAPLYGLRPGWPFAALVILGPLAVFLLVERSLIILLPRGVLGW